MIQIEKRTLLEVLSNACKEFGDENFVSWVDEQPITYLQFGEKVTSVAKFLQDTGIKKNDKVAILSENHPNWSISYFAIVSIGAIAVPIMTEFHPSEVHHVLRHSESKAIFISSKLFYKIDDLEHDGLETKILIDDFSIIPPQTKSDRLKDFLIEGKKELEKIKLAALKLVGLADDEVKEDDLAAILYTSGTTGHSKGVMLTHKNIVSDAISTLGIVTLTHTDRMLSILPLFHTIESTLGLVTPMLCGSKVFYLNKPPTAAALLPALAKVKPTAMVAVPLVIEKIFKMKILPQLTSKYLVRNLYKLPAVRKKLHKVAGKKLFKTFGGELRMFCIGGAPISAEVERFLKEGGFPYAIGYGLTETSPLLTGTGPEAVRLRSAGRPIPEVEIEIRDEDPITGEGEIFARGPMVMKGYYKDPEKSKEVLIDDGWFKTGDLGVLDNDGYLFIKGRSKNVIIGSNGKNIYPEEIESIVNENPYVLESLVHDKEGKLITRVFLNSEAINNDHQIEKLNESKTREIIDKILVDILNNVNNSVSSFSKLHRVIEQAEPFEKTPTQKIKRYLYM
ncbi:long-chain-fatty-acid--coa ligase [hydrocarbon metagenome]|uniref:Long-chain-fatty-acid--coa ligase n=1 Tax=hydrocarbon metagenome TaxID=938273 RepID=A0A0W8FW79_9ZZZZ